MNGLSTVYSTGLIGPIYEHIWMSTVCSTVLLVAFMLMFVCPHMLSLTRHIAQCLQYAQLVHIVNEPCAQNHSYLHVSCNHTSSPCVCVLDFVHIFVLLNCMHCVVALLSSGQQ